MANVILANARVHSYATELPTAPPGEMVEVDGVPLMDGQYALFTELGGRRQYDQDTGTFGAPDMFEAGAFTYIGGGSMAGYRFTSTGSGWTAEFIENAPSEPLEVVHVPPENAIEHPEPEPSPPIDETPPPEGA